MSSLPEDRAFTHVLIDLDDTLYRNEAIAAQVRASIQQYMVDHLGVPEADVAGVTETLYRQYGTTMAGLVAQGHTIDYDHWHAEVHHTLDYPQLLHEDPALRQMLFDLNLQRHILTNADAVHAAKCLARLGLEGCFQSVFCFENVQQLAAEEQLLTADAPVMCKPSPAVYELVLKRLGAEARQTIFIDDSLRNVAAARQLGIFTVLIGHYPADAAGADLVLPTIHHLRSALPSIFHADKLGSLETPGIPIVVTA